MHRSHVSILQTRVQALRAAVDRRHWADVEKYLRSVEGQVEWMQQGETEKRVPKTVEGVV